MEEMNILLQEGLSKLFDEKTDKDPSAEKCPPTKGRFPEDTPIGMAYVPFQFWEKPYGDGAAGDTTALRRGTIFPSLDKPFIGEEAVKHG